MRQRIREVRGGINRITALLLALIGVMLVVIAVPVWQSYRYRAEKTACEQAMKSARDGLIIEYLSRWDEGTVQDAMQTLDEVLPERANICPSGGTVYLVRGENDIFEPLCGLHDSDGRRRARLNASRALELLEPALRYARRENDGEPEAVDIELNGRTLNCVRVDSVPPLKRGTGTTNGYEGVVALYGLAGEGEFSQTAAKRGEICFFVYADEDYCAIWRADDGWTGDAYAQ